MACNDRHLLITSIFLGCDMPYFSFFQSGGKETGNNFSFIDHFMQIDVLKKKFLVPPWNFKAVPS